MFYITAQACHKSTLAEVLTMAAMNNLETSRRACGRHVRPKTATVQRG